MVEKRKAEGEVADVQEAADPGTAEKIVQVKKRRRVNEAGVEIEDVEIEDVQPAKEIVPDVAIEEKATPEEPSEQAKDEGESEEKAEVEEVQECGEVFVFGRGDCGQLGLGEEVDEALRPKLVKLDEKVVDIACGGMHTVVATESGKVLSWGVNDEGALGRPTSGELWEKADESLKVEECKDSYKPALVSFPETGIKIRSLSAGDSHTLALDSEGKLWGWGTYRNNSGVLGFSSKVAIQIAPAVVLDPEVVGSKVVKIFSGANHSVALLKNGKVLTWGSNESGPLARLDRIEDERANKDKLLTPSDISLPENWQETAGGVSDVCTGQYNTFVFAKNGDVWGCGLNNAQQLTLEGEGVETLHKLQKLQELCQKNVVKIISGSHHSLALTQDAKVLSFGRTLYGALGQKGVDINQNESKAKPEAVSGMAELEIKGIAAREQVSGCFSSKGDVYMWGCGTSGQLAKGDDEDDEAEPARVKRTKAFKGFKVVQLDVGGMHVGLIAEKEEVIQPNGKADK